jgi:hypothetical protein
MRTQFSVSMPVETALLIQAEAEKQGTSVSALLVTLFNAQKEKDNVKTNTQGTSTGTEGKQATGKAKRNTNKKGK